MKRSLIAATLVMLVLRFSPAAANFTPPLPSPDLPAGVVTVKVVGSGLADKKVGQEVQLLRVEGGKEVLHATTSSGADGRARFQGMVPQKQYLLQLRIGERVIRSSVISPPASGGYRFLVSLQGETRMGMAVPPPQRAGQAAPGPLPSGHPPMGGEARGHPRQEAAGPPGIQPDKKLAMGELVVRVMLGTKKHPLKGAVVSLLQQKGDTIERTRLNATDEQGEVKTTLEPGRYALEVTHEEMRYSSQTFSPAREHGQRAELQVFVRSSDLGQLKANSSSHWVCEISEEVVRFMQVIQLQNRADAVLQLPKTMTFPLPEGARNLELPKEVQEVARLDKGKNAVLFLGPVQPGTLTLRFYYEIPFEGSAMDLQQQFPVDLEGAALVVLNPTESFRLAGPASAGPSRPAQRGITFPLKGGKAGAPVAFSLEGLPHRDTTLLKATLILASLLCLWGIFAAMGRGRQKSEREDEREKILQQLVQLHRGGKGKEEKRRKKQQELIARLKQVWEVD